MDQPGQALFCLEPEYRERVWGGRRLRAADPPVGEAWLAFGLSRVANGPAAGRTLDDLAAARGELLLGPAAVDRFGARFPLIVKLLDCAAWLSVQVHPDDEQARRLVGPGEFGKTEAWYFVDAPPEAMIMAGVRPGIEPAELAAAIRSGRVLDVMADVPVAAGSSLLLPAGTLHSLGPGLLVYEIQEASDITFRAYDWDRPQTGGRRLHVEEAVEVARPVGPAPCVQLRPGLGSAVVPGPACDYFEMALLRVEPGSPLESTTAGSFQALTVIEGAAAVGAGGETSKAGRFETILVSAGAGSCVVSATGGPATLLRASVPAAS